MHKKLFLIILIAAIQSGYSQRLEPPVLIYGVTKILFNYDSAGNQVQRQLCINCSLFAGKTAEREEVVEIVKLGEKEFQEKITFYPNPVSEELHIEWSFPDHRHLNSLAVFTIEGKQVMQYDNLHEMNSFTVPFASLSAGSYIIVYSSTDGERKSIKILKK